MKETRNCRDMIRQSTSWRRLKRVWVQKSSSKSKNLSMETCARWWRRVMCRRTWLNIRQHSLFARKTEFVKLLSQADSNSLVSWRETLKPQRIAMWRRSSYSRVNLSGPLSFRREPCQGQIVNKLLSTWLSKTKTIGILKRDRRCLTI